MKRFCAVSSIIIPPNRHRKEFDPNDLQDLQSSITSTGLLHAVVLELVGSDYILRAGERRLRAVLDIYELGGEFKYDGDPVPKGLIPYTLWTDLTDIQRLQIEVDENSQRRDFTWQESANATAALERLRSLQAAEANLPPPTVADLAQERRGASRGQPHEDTRNDLILARHLSDPDVARAKTSREAMRILKAKEQAARHERLAATFGAVMTSASHTCINTDAAEWIKTCADESFDVILTDPPYGIGADDFGTASEGSATAHGYSDSVDTLVSILEWFPHESYRVAKPEAHLYLFLDIEWFAKWREVLGRAGWKVFRTPIVWVKPTGFRTPWIDQGPQRKYELCLYAVKGEKKVNMIAPDVISMTSGEGLGHPAAKPPALYAELLKRSVKPGDAVLDPFCGTGPIFSAAHQLKCLATGIEIDTTFYGTSLEQINNLKE
jgi:DNA modification methylase